MVKLKRQYFGHLMWRVDSLKKTWMLGGIGGRSRGGQHRMRLDSITDLMGMSLSKLRKLLKDREAWRATYDSWGCKESDMTEWLNWTELKFHAGRDHDRSRSTQCPRSMHCPVWVLRTDMWMGGMRWWGMRWLQVLIRTRHGSPGAFSLVLMLRG